MCLIMTLCVQLCSRGNEYCAIKSAAIRPCQSENKISDTFNHAQIFSYFGRLYTVIKLADKSISYYNYKRYIVIARGIWLVRANAPHLP